MRHTVLGVAVVVGLLSSGVIEGEVLVLIALVAELVNHAVVVARPRAAAWVTAIDAGLLVELAALGLEPALVLVLGVAVLAWAATFRPVGAIAAYAAVLAAVGAMYVSSGARLTAGVGVLSFCLLGAIFMVRTIRLNMGARRAAERERLVAEQTDAILWERDPSTCVVKVSPAAQRLLGHPGAAWDEPGFAETLVHDDDRVGFDRFAGGGSEHADTFRMQHADGSYRWMESRRSSVSDRHGRHVLFAGVLTDRTDQVEAEREALLFGHLVASSPIGQVVLRCDRPSPVIEAVNQAGQRVLGLGPDVLGAALTHVAAPVVRVDELLRLLANRHGRDACEFLGADGRVYQVGVGSVDEHRCSLDFLDVTERVEAGQRLHDQARRDYLTGLPNRRAFVEHLEQHLASSPDAPAAVLIVDLDDFKDINDSLGHETGDRLLCRLGQRIADVVTGADVVARLGGDEFALVLTGVDAATAIRRADSLIESIRQPLVIDGLRLLVRASAGIAMYPADADGATELMRRGDVAMYRAKNRGIGVARYDPATDPSDRDRIAMVAALEAAIAADGLTLHHQPLVGVATGRVMGVEALARWDHVELGSIPPGTFIELAEVSGQIRALTRWVIRRAVSDLLTLGPPADSMFVSVNLSARNLYEDDLIDWIAALLAEFDVDPCRLVVEITESMVMEDPAAAMETLAGLRRMGIRAWIDDFGTGHSSFGRLRTLPVDGVKIDQSFIVAAAASPDDEVILRHLVELVRALDLQCIAEGVETAEQEDLLRRLDCGTAQGFHIARPMPIDRLHDFLGSRGSPELDRASAAAG